MLAQLHAASAELKRTAPAQNGLRDEACELLDWMAANNFTLLGYCEYRLERGPKQDKLIPVPGAGLGLLRSDEARKPLTLSREMRPSGPLQNAACHY